VAITFDDGFHDFLHHAVPVLHEFGYPSTLYLTTHYCGYPVPIFHLVTSYLLWKSRLPVADLTRFGVEQPALLRTYEERQVAVEALREWARQNQLDTMARDMAARQLADLLSIDYDDILNSRLLQILTPDEVSTAARAGVDIQLHAHRHRTPRNRDLFLREILDNRDRIRAMTGRGPVHFCYPSGDYAPEFLPWLREAGVQSATTCVLGLAGPASDPLLLPRVLDDSTVGDIDFESWVCGIRAL
jgi:peptidoglycan/xylan/chitin deacetylase (PgdA/CDA1 family)